MRQPVWVYAPHLGGRPIPPAVRERTQARIVAHARKRYADRFTRLAVRFRGALCYVDAFTEPAPPTRGDLKALGETRERYLERLRSVPIHLCRLRYFGDEDRWTLGFYTYSNERYSPSAFRNGTFHGTPEEALDIGSVYLPAPPDDADAGRRRSRRTRRCT